ncbi:MAG: hypothetical protein M0R40_02875 [Firmicutes bacterium]|nr:hypothetical protein [Bacillota bacterium]
MDSYTTFNRIFIQRFTNAGDLEGIIIVFKHKNQAQAGAFPLALDLLVLI